MSKFGKTVLLAMAAFLIFCFVSPLAFANGATYVDSCDVSSSFDGETLMVTDDLVAAGSYDCIVITHENVTVDCQGYRLTGFDINEWWYGVWVLGVNALVQNCEFNNWDAALVIEADYGTALNNKVFENNYGIAAVWILEGPWIEGNKADDNFNAGIYILLAENSVVYDNTVHGTACSDDTGGGFGIGLDEADYNYVVGNQTNLNCENGILLQNGSDNNHVYNNTSNRNKEGREGIVGNGIAVVSSSVNNVVEDNTVNRNDRGMYTSPDVYGLNDFDGNRCKNNFIADYTEAGQCK